MVRNAGLQGGKDGIALAVNLAGNLCLPSGSAAPHECGRALYSSINLIALFVTMRTQRFPRRTRLSTPALARL